MFIYHRLGVNTLSNNSISKEQIARYAKNYNEQNKSKVLERAVTKNGILATSEGLRGGADFSPVFSIDLKTGAVANQKQSGRCWMFAALNTMRHHLSDEFKLKDFELSQNYTFFWDKFEKSNWFYENVIATADKPTSDRKVSWLTNEPQGDGGQWDMLCALIDKYGIVPESVYPETYNSNKSNEFNTLLNEKLRKDAVELRELVNDDKTSDEQVQSRKEKMLGEVYRMASYSFGEPPATFDWEYRDDDKNYHREAGLTPKSFYEKFVGWDLKEYVSIINAPTDDKPFNHTYSIEMLGNVVGGRQVKHLNLTMHDFKQAAINQLKAGQSVWFGCDVGQHSEPRTRGLLDLGVYDEEALFDIDLSMSKAERLDYSESLMTHAMVITGVDLVDGEPKKWKVENSWGKKVGSKGYMVMTDDWMSEYCYQVVVNKQFLTEAQRKAQAEEPTQLLPWDPMGALAYKD
ncbi:C1 family peptidase [Pediococcus inopinatus]|uniref:aminopeptidase C n=1 Tax=Pediococcus inopinatus TaxID=114090 RepID=UPI002B25AA3C|nr:C1 family peptidase [Pediococcus inopinatus]WPC19676.1 C1 family peptidase [Pediococcus inopinatus]